MDLLHRKAQSYKFSNKNGLFCAWRDFNKTFCAISAYHKWIFKLQISSIFNFDRAHQSWISGLLGVKRVKRFADKDLNISDVQQYGGTVHWECPLLRFIIKMPLIALRAWFLMGCVNVGKIDSYWVKCPDEQSFRRYVDRAVIFISSDIVQKPKSSQSGKKR